MYRYEGKDNYCYKDTNVLINKFNIKDAVLLEEKERKLTLINTIKIYNEIDLNKNVFDIKYYKLIHKNLFSEIYNFAGEYRNIVLIKGNTRFCEPQYIENYLKDIFKNLKDDKYLYKLKAKEFIKKIAFYYSELNAVHAFREGNGRTNRIFIDLLSKSVGYDLGIANWNNKEQIKATIEAMKGNLQYIEKIIIKNIEVI